jgi:hypothetical protein
MADLGYAGSDVNGPLGQLAARWRGLADATLQEFSYISKLGVAGLQAAPYNLSQADAEATFDAFNYMQTLAKMYFGQVAQPQFNYDDALAIVRGGQVA